MSQNAQDLRVRRTHKLVREAFISLVEEQGFDTITVGDIAKRAMVSRAAFYRHYQDKYQLVEQIFEDAIQTMMSSVGDFDPEQPPEAWVKLFEHISEYERLYRVLLGEKASSWFLTQMRAHFVQSMKQAAAGAPFAQAITMNSAHADGFIQNLLAALIVDSIVWWLEQGKHCSPNQIATRCSRLAIAICREADTWRE
jgi:AcrR family transcriptional regulator